MKKCTCILLITVMLFSLCACDSAEYADVTPRTDVIEGICIQRTNIDEAGQYSYFEKNIEEAQQITEFCKSIDKIKFVEIDPQKFNSVDFLIVFEGKKEHKMMISGNKIIYDGLAYEIKNGELVSKISEIYSALSQQESKAVSKLFR